MESEKIIDEQSKKIDNVLLVLERLAKIDIKDFSDRDLEEAKEVGLIVGEILEGKSKLADIKSSNTELIKKVEEMKKVAPLVPIEDFSLGITQSKYNELVEEIKIIDAFYQKIDSVESLYQPVRKLSEEYENNKLQEQEAKKAQEKKERQIEEIKKLLKTPETAQGELLKVRFIHTWTTWEERGYNYNEPSWYAEQIVEKTHSKISDAHNFYTTSKARKLDELGVCILGKEISDAETIDIKIYDKEFVPYSDCELLEKQGCKEIEERIKEIISSPSPEFDEKVEIPILLKTGETIYVTMSERELAENGLLLEDIRSRDYYKPKESTTNIAEIAEADKKNAITTRETNGIRGLINKIISAFRIQR